nr:reverse transcriptase domain-containing protein [Tanacetum cinerariifolium]
MKERYAKFIDLIKEVRISVPLVDVLAGMPDYGRFVKDLMGNKSKMEQIYSTFLNEECFAIVQNKLPPKLGFKAFLKSDAFARVHIIRKLPVSPSLEKDDKVPLILGRPFLHTIDAITRVKNKKLNLGVGDDRITFLIDKAMQHSHSNDDTCFHIDIINEVMEQEFDALLDDSKPFLNTSEKINETSLDKVFEEFMDVDVKEIPEQEEEVKDNFQKLPLEKKLRIKPSIQDPPTDLEMKLYLNISNMLFCKKIPFFQDKDIDDNLNLKELRDEDIDDNFLDETLMNVSSNDEEEISHGFPSGYVKLYDKHKGSFIVNGYRVKLYHDEEQLNKLKSEEIHLMYEKGKMKAILFMASFPADYCKTMPCVIKKPFIYSEVENTCNKAKLHKMIVDRRLVPSCFAIFDLEPLSLSFEFIFTSEIFNSLSFSLNRLCHLPILCLDHHAHTLHHLKSFLTISLDRLDILKEDLIYQSFAEVFVFVFEFS